MLPETIIAATATYILMLVAYYFPRIRTFHIGTMVTVMLFDLMMPFYLYLHRDWKERLIDGGEIFSFLIWMHVGLIITVYGLYAAQINAGIKLARKTGDTRETHRGQAKGILLVRALMILTGALLYEPLDTP